MIHLANHAPNLGRIWTLYHLIEPPESQALHNPLLSPETTD
jgi:hypothetical protein